MKQTPNSRALSPYSWLFTLSICLHAYFLSSCDTYMGDKDITGDASTFSSRSSSGSSGGSGQGGTPSGGVLTAGEWNDLKNWAFWQSVMEKEEWKETMSSTMRTWGFYPTQPPVSVTLLQPNTLGAVAQQVTLLSENRTLWQAVSNNHGQVILWPGLLNAQAPNPADSVRYRIQVNGAQHQQPPSPTRPNQYTIEAPQTPQNIMEVMFVVDATGSMGDELEFLKNEVLDVLRRVKTNNPLFEVRSAAVFYRDHGDEYLTRNSSFTTDPARTSSFIKEQSANGGGDWPEAVDKGLEVAIRQTAWTARARTKVLFLILDAPPHEKPEVIQAIQEHIKEAARMGIRIVPVAASGINKNTEFLLRFYAMATNGTYVFLTDHSGVGNPHLVPTVGEYQVEFLNDLMVRLLNEYSK